MADIFERQILKPWNVKEAITLKQAGEIAGRCAETMRMWAEDGLGRKIAGGRWAISHPALLMRLEGNSSALKGLCASSSAKRGGRSGWLSGFAKSAFLMLLQVVHVEIAVGLEPVLMRLHRQRPHQPAA
jgi:hypothetical protein